MKIITETEARTHLGELIEQVIGDGDYAIIEREDSRNAVILSQALFTSMLETDYLLRSPANAAHLLQSLADVAGGRRIMQNLIDPA